MCVGVMTGRYSCGQRIIRGRAPAGHTHAGMGARQPQGHVLGLWTAWMASGSLPRLMTSRLSLRPSLYALRSANLRTDVYIAVAAFTYFGAADFVN